MANPSESTTAATPTATETPSSGSSTAVHPNRRRIIKANHPKVGEDGGLKNGGNYSTYVSPTAAKKGGGGGNDDDDDNVSYKKKSGKKYEVTLPEDTAESVEQWKEERLKSATTRSKALRNEKVQARRKMTTPPVAEVSANPFSRFKSIFSVESQFPEHKRKSSDAGVSEDETEEAEVVHPPEEKRLKPSHEDDNDNDDTSANKKNDSGFFFSSNNTIKLVWVTAAVALAVGVAMALQRGRKK